MQSCYLEGVSFVSLNLEQDGYPNSNNVVHLGKYGNQLEVGNK